MKQDHTCEFVEQFRMKDDMSGLEPDGFACQVCGKRKETVQVELVLPWYHTNMEG